jgi:hypothetical protein
MSQDYSKMIESFRGVACIMSLRKEKDGDKGLFRGNGG